MRAGHDLPFIATDRQNRRGKTEFVFFKKKPSEADRKEADRVAKISRPQSDE